MTQTLTRSTSPIDTKKATYVILTKALRKKREGALVVSLSGPLGAGKTAFVKYAASFFGIQTNKITSPTFVLVKRYKTKKHAKIFSTLYHADAYRTTHEKEFEALGFREILKDINAIIFVEWGEYIQKILPKKNIIRVTIEYGKKEKERIITTKYI